MARILVVDDDPDILKLTEKVLTQAGHTVATAADAMKAMSYLDSVGFDLLISDANMPHYTGFDLIQTIKKNVKFKNLSIAMLTGLRERKDLDKALKAGVDDYIVKPLDPLLLLQKIEALLIRNPPQQHPEIRFHHETKISEVQMLAHLHVRSISELGIELSAKNPIPVGDCIELRGDIFDTIGIIPPPLKVLSCQAKTEDDGYVVQLLFLGATEATLQKIRRWIFSHGSLNKDDAA